MFKDLKEKQIKKQKRKKTSLLLIPLPCGAVGM
jgi:hypothetical protein